MEPQLEQAWSFRQRTSHCDRGRIWLRDDTGRAGGRITSAGYSAEHA
jgi:hypothetical protein